MRAYLTLRTARAGVAAPEIVEAGTAGPSRDALLADGGAGNQAILSATETGSARMQSKSDRFKASSRITTGQRDTST